MTITMPAMSSEQEASWHGLFDLAERVPDGWTLVGGQLVHLHCAERGVRPLRATPDIDVVLHLRKHPRILMTVTTALQEAGFVATAVTMGEKQHRWVRGRAAIEVLIPAGVGRAASYQGAGGFPGLPTPGAQYALDRSEPVEVSAGGRSGVVWRPTIIGAVVMKAAAHSVASDLGRARHLDDLAVLAALLTARDLRSAALRRGERSYLRRALSATAEHPPTDGIDGARDGIVRLERLVQA